jgi:hypothetical protein
MQRRTQYLLIGLIGVIVLWQGGIQISSAFLEPLWKKEKELAELEESVDKRTKELILLARQRKNLTDWKKRSLPPDKATKKERPDALNAQRLYGDWLHDLALLSGFEDLRVQPDRLAVSRDNVYVSVGVKIEADARFEQLCRFLDRFYRADLLHRVTSLRISTRESEGDPVLTIQLEAEGLAIVGAPDKRLLFPQTVLIEELPDEATQVFVEPTDSFPKEPGFLVRLRDELVKVTAIDGTTWTVERAQDGTTAASHAPGTIVESMPILAGVSARTADEFKQLMDSNLFVKPAPPVQYKPRIAPLGEKSLTRGKPIEFNIVAMGYDLSKGRPEFQLKSPAPAGSKLDKSTGKFSWAPTADQKAGKYTFKFEVKHPSAPGGHLDESVTITLRDPNTAPKIVTRPDRQPPVLIGREWKYKVEATDAETASEKLSYKLGENPPPGMSINSQTGELTWTPGEATETGETTVQVIVTDDGSQPQSTTLSLKLKLEDDVAMFTYLTTIFAVDGKVLAKLYDRSQDKFTELRVGTRFSIADIQGTVTKIDKKHLLFARGPEIFRLEIGQSLREIQAEKQPVLVPAAEEIPDASRPANVPARDAATDSPAATGRSTP